MCLAKAGAVTCSSLLMFSLSLRGVRPGVKPGVTGPRGVNTPPDWGVIPSDPWPCPGVLLKKIWETWWRVDYHLQSQRCFWNNRWGGGGGAVNLKGVERTVLGVWICWRCGVTPLKSLSCSGVLRPPFKGVSMLVRAMRFWASWKSKHRKSVIRQQQRWSICIFFF